MANFTDLSTLHSHLDKLWLRYLTLLEEYTTAQTQLQKTFSAGFFSLAEANFKARGAGLGVGRRFGKDFYDDRMVAQMRVKVGSWEEECGEAGGERERMIVEVVEGEVKGKEDGADEEGKEEEDHATSPSPSTMTTPGPNLQSANDSSETSLNSGYTGNPDPTPRINTHDPLRWFGILIPTSLRTAQTHFSQAVMNQNCVSKAINAARGMREIEVEIRKLRKVIRKVEKESIVAAAADLSQIHLVRA